MVSYQLLDDNLTFSLVVQTSQLLLHNICHPSYMSVQTTTPRTSAGLMLSQRRLVLAGKCSMTRPTWTLWMPARFLRILNGSPPPLPSPSSHLFFLLFVIFFLFFPFLLRLLSVCQKKFRIVCLIGMDVLVLVMNTLFFGESWSMGTATSPFIALLKIVSLQVLVCTFTCLTSLAALRFTRSKLSTSFCYMDPHMPHIQDHTTPKP